MEKLYQLLMDKQKYNKGSVLIELISSLIVISILFLLILPMIKVNDYSHLLFFSEYLYNQSLSMANKEDNDLNITSSNYDFYKDISFNEKGNVNLAQSISLYSINKKIDYVVQLGGGRLVRKK